MRKNYVVLVITITLLYSLTAKAQNYSAKVSRDSVGILNARMDALKASIKVQELKLKEFEEEVAVEKLRLKLLEANGNAKESAIQHNDLTEKLKSGGVDAKTSEKVAKKAKNDMLDAQKALERFNKQIEKVESVRNEIKTEERKLLYKKPVILYNYD